MTPNRLVSLAPFPLREGNEVSGTRRRKGAQNGWRPSPLRADARSACGSRVAALGLMKLL